jgi:hypothetical protein
MIPANNRIANLAALALVEAPAGTTVWVDSEECKYEAVPTHQAISGAIAGPSDLDPISWQPATIRAILPNGTSVSSSAISGGPSAAVVDGMLQLPETGECKVVDRAINPTVYLSTAPALTPSAGGHAITLPAITGRCYVQIVHAPTGATGSGYVWYADASNYCAISAAGLISVCSVGVTVTALHAITWTGGQSVAVRITFGGSLDTVIEASIAGAAHQILGVLAPIPSPASALVATYVARSWTGVLATVLFQSSRATSLYRTTPRAFQGQLAGYPTAQQYYDIRTSSPRVASLGSTEYCGDAGAMSSHNVRVNKVWSAKSPDVVLGPSLCNASGLTGENVIRCTSAVRVYGAARAPDFGSFGTDLVCAYTDSPAEIVTEAPTNFGLAMVGDSVTAGVGATDPGHYSHAAIIRYSLTANVAIFGIGSVTTNSHYTDYALLARAVAKSLASYSRKEVVIHLGINDWFAGFSAANITTYMTAILDAIHTAIPGVAVWISSPGLMPGEAVANTGGATGDDYRLAIATVANSRGAWCRYIHGLGLTGDRGGGNHPTDAGYATDAAVYLARLNGGPAELTSILGSKLVGRWCMRDATLNGSSQITAVPALVGPSLTASGTTYFATALDARGRRYLTNATAGNRILSTIFGAGVFPQNLIIVANFAAPATNPAYMCLGMVGTIAGTGVRQLQMNTASSGAWIAGTIGHSKNGAAPDVAATAGIAVWSGATANPSHLSVGIGNDLLQPTDNRTFIGDIHEVLALSSNATQSELMLTSASLRGDYDF